MNQAQASRNDQNTEASKPAQAAADESLKNATLPKAEKASCCTEPCRTDSKSQPASTEKAKSKAKAEVSPRTLEEFYPYYLKAHRDPVCRGLHYTGNVLGVAGVVASVATGTFWAVPVAFALGYVPAWIGHLVFEKNKPATWDSGLRPKIFSFLCDWRMMFREATGTLKKDYERYNIK